jgi:subtilisin family serine protease
VIGSEPYEFFSGTSMSSPHTTGTAALVASEFPGLLNKPVALKKVFVENGKPLSSTRGKTVTGDMVDARAAVTRDRGGS